STHPPHSDTYTLPLHDALPISSALELQIAMICDTLLRMSTSKRRAPHTLDKARRSPSPYEIGRDIFERHEHVKPTEDIARHSKRDRKSTRLNSSHLGISYAVFC